MRATLCIEGGPLNGKEISLSTEPILIGRDAKCQVRLEGDAVSRIHCTLLLRENDFFVRDENSRNGTYVNKRRLRGELQLQDGDAIQVGPQLFSVRLETILPALDNDGFVFDDSPATPADGSTFIGHSIIDPDELKSEEDEKLKNRLGKL